MDKQNINEELDKFKLYSKYNTLRTLQENVEDIFEQAVSPEQEIYNLLKKATIDTMGTNEELLKQAFEKFKDGNQFRAVEKMMQSKPIGGIYSTLPGLLKGELESDNYNDFLEMQKTAQPKGIYLKSAPVDKKSGQFPYDTITITIAAVKPRTTPSGYTLPQQTNQPSQNPVTPRVENKPKVTFKANENFPITFMDMGDKVKKLQTALGVVNKAGEPNISGKFYTSTEQKLVNKMNELGLKYDRNKGVDEETFSLILSGPKPSRQMEKPIEVDKKDVNLNVTKKISTQAPTIQTPQANLTPQEQRKVDKMRKKQQQ